MVLKKVDKFTMKLDTTDGGISNVLYSVGERERVFMGILKRAIKDGDVCIDLGANIGYTTLYMLDAVGDNGYVYAIEPDLHNLDLLKENIKINNYSNRVTVDRCAISNKNTVSDFWIASKPNLNSVTKTKHSIRKEQIKFVTLGEYLKGKKYPNFIKMDVEGHEVKIFEGALDYFTKNDGPTKILVEVHPHFYDEDNNFEAILKEYFKIGFSCKAAVSTPVPRPKKLIDAGYEPVLEMPTDGFVRGLYVNLQNDHLLDFACREHHESGSKKIIRSFLLGRD